MHALDSGRIEKKFVHFGHDVADVDTPVEAGMRWVCRMDKPVPFIGHGAVARPARLEPTAVPSGLLQFLLADPEPLLFGHEPVLRRRRGGRLPHFGATTDTPSAEAWGSGTPGTKTA